MIKQMLSRNLNLNEETTGSGVDNVAQIDQKNPVEDVYQQLQVPSLGRHLFKNLRLKGASASILVLDENPKKAGTIALLKQSIECYPSAPIRTEITQEALQDLQATYGKHQASLHVANMLRALAYRYENDKMLEFLEANAKDAGSLQLSDKKNAETRMFELTNAVQTCVLEANAHTKRTYASFAIMPYKYVSAIMTTYAYTTGLDTTDIHSLLVANFALSRYYINPNPDDNHCYVGLRAGDDGFEGSCYFGDYTNYVQKMVDPDSGQLTYCVYDRFGFAMNPLHMDNNPMLFKFTISE